MLRYRNNGHESAPSELVGLSFAYKEGEAFYVPIDNDRGKAQQRIEFSDHF